MEKDILDKMTKAELILWIKENLFLQKKPKWSWVLDKRYQSAEEKEEAMREDAERIPPPDYDEYNAKTDLKKMDKYHAAVEKRNVVRKDIDKQYQKTNNLFKQLQKAWEDERNERSNTNK